MLLSLPKSQLIDGFHKIVDDIKYYLFIRHFTHTIHLYYNVRVM
jgi:hypothetical protein